MGIKQQNECIDIDIEGRIRSVILLYVLEVAAQDSGDVGVADIRGKECLDKDF